MREPAPPEHSLADRMGSRPQRWPSGWPPTRRQAWRRTKRRRDSQSTERTSSTA